MVFKTQKESNHFELLHTYYLFHTYPKKSYKSVLVKVFQSYKQEKFAVKKKLRHFGFEATEFI